MPLVRRLVGHPAWPIRDPLALACAGKIAKHHCKRWHSHRLRRPVSEDALSPDRLAEFEKTDEPPRDWGWLASVLPELHASLDGRDRAVFEKLFFQHLGIKRTAQLLSLEPHHVRRSLTRSSRRPGDSENNRAMDGPPPCTFDGASRTMSTRPDTAGLHAAPSAGAAGEWCGGSGSRSPSVRLACRRHPQYQMHSRSGSGP